MTGTGAWRRLGAASFLFAVLLITAGCNLSPQRQGNVQILPMQLSAYDLESGGLAFLTPSSATGQEEDRQALALAFLGVLTKARPQLKVVSLPATLTAINAAGLGKEYRAMLEDYRATGLLDRKTLARISELTGVRYLALLKLAGFKQESKGRWGTFGLRVLDTKVTTMRVFLQLWDGKTGAIVWEGSVESTMAFESISEDSVSFQTAVEETARWLIDTLP